MTKAEPRIESIYNINKYLEKDDLLPVYFLFGEDEFTINEVINGIKNKLQNLILSEFDFETISCTRDSNLSSIIDLAYSFPFGGGKKLIILKDFENCNEKKSFIDYINNPADFTFFVISQKGKKIDLREKIFKSLIDHGYIFEAREMSKSELISWVVAAAAKNKMKISKPDAETLIDFVGNNKAMLDMNLNKFQNSVSTDGQITIELIENLGSSSKEFSALNLLNSIINKNKAEAIEIADSLLDKTDDNAILNILGLLTRFILTMVKMVELDSQRLSTFEASKASGVSEYFYKNCQKAHYLKNEMNLKNAVDAMLEADVLVKTTSLDSKTILMSLIARLIP